MHDLEARLHGLVRRIEQAQLLDAPAAVAGAAARRLTRGDAAARLLGGAPLGHRLHPVLTDAPIGAWTSASILDLVGGRAARPAARRLVGLGIAAALPTALTGLADWQHTHGRSRRVGVAHMTANGAALALQTLAWAQRRRGHHLRGALTSALAMGTVTAGAYLGGHLVYRARVGVDPEIPVAADGGWRVACRVDELTDGQPLGVTLDGARIAVVRDLGEVHALAAVCSHAGGPLDRGDVRAGTLQCPWHGSRFCLADGRVERGPAASPQPRYDVRVRDGRVEVRLPGSPPAPAALAPGAPHARVMVP